MSGRLAAVDLGADTVRVVAAETAGPDCRTLRRGQHVTGPGVRQAGAGRLLEAPVRRTVQALAEPVARAGARGAGEMRALATSAVRQVPTRDEFVAAGGCAVAVVSGDEEARSTGPRTAPGGRAGDTRPGPVSVLSAIRPSEAR